MIGSTENVHDVQFLLLQCIILKTFVLIKVERKVDRKMPLLFKYVAQETPMYPMKPPTPVEIPFKLGAVPY